MKNTKAQNLVSITAQRWIPANETQKFVDRLREYGVSNDQLKMLCAEYIIINTDLSD